MDGLAEACERVANHAGRLAKVATLAAYFRTLESDDDLRRAVQFLLGRPAAMAPAVSNLFETVEPPKLALGYAVIRDALRAAS
ncbi:MAG: hypothetical protein JST65_08435, partial [Acidobacteria bacterium]|nr:hypothetical protein [Acidobacteriota bacterium]